MLYQRGRQFWRRNPTDHRFLFGIGDPFDAVSEFRIPCFLALFLAKSGENSLPVCPQVVPPLTPGVHTGNNDVRTYYLYCCLPGTLPVCCLFMIWARMLVHHSLFVLTSRSLQYCRTACLQQSVLPAYSGPYCPYCLPTAYLQPTYIPSTGTAFLYYSGADVCTPTTAGWDIHLVRPNLSPTMGHHQTEVTCHISAITCPIPYVFVSLSHPFNFVTIRPPIFLQRFILHEKRRILVNPFPNQPLNVSSPRFDPYIGYHLSDSVRFCVILSRV
jgi:hypothetical protein